MNEAMPVDLIQTSAVSTAKLVIVLGRAYRSLADFLEGGLALQGISVADFGILEALLHKGPLAGSVIGAKIAQLPDAAIRQAMGRLIRRGLIRRQTSRDGSVAVTVAGRRLGGWVGTKQGTKPRSQERLARHGSA